MLKSFIEDAERPSPEETERDANNIEVKGIVSKHEIKLKEKNIRYTSVLTVIMSIITVSVGMIVSLLVQWLL